VELFQRIWSKLFGTGRKSKKVQFTLSPEKARNVIELMLVSSDSDVILRDKKDGTFEVFSTKNLTPEQVVSLSRGDIPKGIEKVLRI